jgi:hypothetical protein
MLKKLLKRGQHTLLAEVNLLLLREVVALTTRAVESGEKNTKEVVGSPFSQPKVRNLVKLGVVGALVPYTSAS